MIFNLIYFFCKNVGFVHAGVYFTIQGQTILNNSIVSLSRIGEGADALLCKTDRVDCCGTPPNRFGEFYYPSGITVRIRASGEGFYRNRGDQEIRLNRREGVSSPTGRFSCYIPDASGLIQSIFITLTI